MTEASTVTEATEIGLLCPDGSVIWPPQTYVGHGIATPEERNAIPNLLAAAAPQMRLDPQTFLASFRWVFRTVTTVVLMKTEEDSLDMTARWEVNGCADAEPPVSTPNE